MSELMKIKQIMDNKFQELKVELQSSCDHEKISDWMEVHWAPGHTTGKLVKECKRCGLQMDETSGHIEFVHDDSQPSGLRQEVTFTDELGVIVVTVTATPDEDDPE